MEIPLHEKAAKHLAGQLNLAPNAVSNEGRYSTVRVSAGTHVIFHDSNQITARTMPVIVPKDASLFAVVELPRDISGCREVRVTPHAKLVKPIINGALGPRNISMTSLMEHTSLVRKVAETLNEHAPKPEPKLKRR